MRGAGHASNHGAVTTAAATTRRLYRRPDHGILGGVAAGIAEHVGLSRKVVRILFIFLAGTGGLGLALYGAYWIVVPVAPGAGRSRLPRWIEYVIAAAAVIGAIAAAA